ncbi:protein AAR2 homolog [Hylaeus volcanicus]|uniref:protein AAR2 homolog n=1 Tax=Hylaeus volcanicus TaxID=313075 RepID=UPI0023B7BD31|nr:protein AAR2 homolog [Hylaeus volcanicus]
MTQKANGVLLLLKVPNGLSIGFDYNSIVFEKNLMGIRNIPLGSHFFYWSPLDEEDNNTLGQCLFFEENKVIVRCWCEETDTFKRLEDDEAERYEIGVRKGDFLLHMACYNSDFIALWKEVSYFISKKVVDRIEPLNKFIQSSGKEYDSSDKEKEVRFEEKLEEFFSEDKQSITSIPPSLTTKEECLTSLAEQKPLKSCLKLPKETDTEQQKLEHNDAFRFVHSNTLFFLEVPKLKLPANAPGHVKTCMMHDNSSILETILVDKLQGEWEQILGEIQFAFVCFLLGKNYDAFEQWKRLIILLSSCDTASQTYIDLFAGYLRVLHNQLLQVPNDFFHESVLSNNFFIQSLGNICEICEGENVPQKLQKRVAFIKKAIVEKFHTSLTEILQLHEDAPLIVDETEPFISF